MDPVRNPFAPGAGDPPPVLAGRQEELHEFETLVKRLRLGRNDQSLLITGLRGVGKTVLLRRFEEIAREHDAIVLDLEAERPSDQTKSQQLFRARLVRQMARRFLQTHPRARWTDRVRRAAGVLRSFELGGNSTGQLTVSLGVEPEVGVADTGDLAEDLFDVFDAIGALAAERGIAWILLVDEMHLLPTRDLGPLLMALHRCTQHRYPITLVGAGLSNLVQRVSSARTYSERLVRLITIGPLDRQACSDAIVLPFRHAGLDLSPEALDTVYGFTAGYPYFVQLYGKLLWNAVDSQDITREIVVGLEEAFNRQLDRSFYAQRYERVREEDARAILLEMARLSLVEGEEMAVSSLVAALQLKPSRFKDMRTTLRNEAVIYTPRRGFVAFTVPKFSDYVYRKYALDVSRIGGLGKGEEEEE